MVTIYDHDGDGNRVVVYDSRWRFPELLGYEKDTKEYRALQERWKSATGRKIPAEEADKVEVYKRK